MTARDPGRRPTAGAVLLVLAVLNVGRGADRERREVPVDDPARPVGFGAVVGPTLSLLGCNAGGCHGKAGGQKGFALSLFNADPAADRAALAARADADDPPSSRLILKATGQVPHGGGARLRVGSAEHRDLLRWIAESARPAAPEPAVVRLDLEPSPPLLRRGEAGQVRAWAVRDDGTVADVTRLARFESTASPVVAVGPTGRLAAGSLVGPASILARYGRHSAAAPVLVGAGPPIEPGSGPEPTGTIDRLVGRRLARLGLMPAPLATDAEFARRASLDVAGALPDPARLAEFEADGRPGKRSRWVDSLLATPGYADAFALKWSAILRNRRTLGELSKPTTFAFHAWLRAAMAANWPFDRIVAAIVAGRGDARTLPAVGWYRLVPTRDERAEDVAQVFLGTRIGCARCHDHPTDRWRQADHAAFAAFFGRVGTKAGADPAAFRVFNLPADPTGGGVVPRALGAPAAGPTGDRDDPRDALLAWMTAPDNPALARTVVNRYWAHFFGTGQVEPLDDFRATNPPTDPELLDALAADFRASGYDLKWLVRTIATSDAYARSSRRGGDDPVAAPGTFARFEPRRLGAEALLDAIDAVAGSTSTFRGVPAGTRTQALPDDGFAAPFLDAFGRPARRTACECERVADPSLAQALFLLNSAEVEGRLAAPDGRAARYAGPDDPRPDAAKVDELYRLALARPPTTDEAARASSHLADRRRDGRAADGFEDLIWALINTKEFLYNH